MRKVIITVLVLLSCYGISFANEPLDTKKFPDFGTEYLGHDRFETFNRKVFNFNKNLNKYAVRPVTIVWSAVMPKYGMDRIKGMYSNILYPAQLVSSLCQGDIKAAGQLSARFLINSTIGLAGMYDPAKNIFKIQKINETMEQALAKWKIKQGPYLVVPVLNSATPRALLGRALDSALDPSSYIGSPAIAAIKAAFTINNATLFQPATIFLENNYIDPYDVVKKAYGVSVAILNSNLDRKSTLKEAQEKNLDSEISIGKDNVCKIEGEKITIKGTTDDKISEKNELYPISDVESLQLNSVIEGSASTDEILYEDGLIPDIILENFNPQHPVTDSMRTALFDIEGVDDSIWGDLSPWNRSFKRRIKTDTIELCQNREPYKYKYILQKDKTAPLAVIFPSIGESSDTHHSTIFAKIFYDEGYSVLILSSAFHYSFVKSLEKGYYPGLPSRDTKYLKDTTSKIIDKISKKHEVDFSDKIVLGTSFGAVSTLYLAQNEATDNKLNISKYISINPPIELIYALNVIDENNEEWKKNPNNIKEKTALTTAKIVDLFNEKDETKDFKIEALPFSPKEAMLITGFVLRQKLTDLLFAIEDIPVNKKTDFYERTNKIGYAEYAAKYLTGEKFKTADELSYIASLHNIKDYLINSTNYRIYHSLDDYLVTREQLKKLRKYAGSKLTLIDKGSHLGFLYRSEFLNDLKKEIALKKTEL